jgi:hypothetical protein
MTPLVGRAEELDLLLRRWSQARDGEGQVVLLPGKPGIGMGGVGTHRKRLGIDPRTQICREATKFLGALQICGKLIPVPVIGPHIDGPMKILRAPNLHRIYGGDI